MLSSTLWCGAWQASNNIMSYLKSFREWAAKKHTNRESLSEQAEAQQIIFLWHFFFYVFLFFSPYLKLP